MCIGKATEPVDEYIRMLEEMGYMFIPLPDENGEKRLLILDMFGHEHTITYLETSPRNNIRLMVLSAAFELYGKKREADGRQQVQAEMRSLLGLDDTGT